jgi:hypothetical protein
MKPNKTERVHTRTDGVPTVAAMPPIEKRTRAGTPLATQNASFQPMTLCNSFCGDEFPTAVVATIVPSLRPPCVIFALRALDFF